MRAELVHDARAALGEGPLWDPTARMLWWLDITGRRLHRYDPEHGPQEAVRLPLDVGAIALADSGGLVAATADGFARVRDGVLTHVVDVERELAEHRMNDGGCDPLGRFWASTMHREAAPGVGTLWRWQGEGDAVPVLRGVSIGNGIAFDAAGERMWFVDSPTRRVDLFDVTATGDVQNRRPAAVLPDDVPGVPDGLAVDEEGGIWVAVWDGWCVLRFDDQGRVTARIDVPVQQVTSCAFSDDALWVTTAGAGVSGQAQAGGLFRCQPGVAGAPVPAFRG